MKTLLICLTTGSALVAQVVSAQQSQPSPAPHRHAPAQQQQSTAPAPARPQRNWQGPSTPRNQFSGPGAGLRQSPGYTAGRFRAETQPRLNRNAASAAVQRYRTIHQPPTTIEQPDLSVTPRVPTARTATGVQEQPAAVAPRPQWRDRTGSGRNGGANWSGHNDRTGGSDRTGGNDREWRWRNRGSTWSGGNWHRSGGIAGAGNFADAYRHYRREHHHRDWWRSHHSRIIFVNRGYYYWDAGWWYPAWGYDPVYSYYAYDGPIYAYDDMAPDEIITRVQEALREEGYYFGAIDGELGPMTREALAAWQRDHGLAITTVIDEPTVRSLGL